MNSSKDLIEELDILEILLNRSRISKFFSTPFRYLFGAILPKFINYKERKLTVKLITGAQFNILFPSSLDIYLWGVKSHDSEIRLTKFLGNYIKEGDSFLDIGAHFGYYSKIANYLSQAAVYSFEPSRKSFKILMSNL